MQKPEQDGRPVPSPQRAAAWAAYVAKHRETFDFDRWRETAAALDDQARRQAAADAHRAQARQAEVASGVPEVLRGAVFNDDGEIVKPDGRIFDQGPGQRRLSEVWHAARQRAVRRAAAALASRRRRWVVARHRDRGHLGGRRRVRRRVSARRGRPDPDEPSADPAGWDTTERGGR